MLRLISVLLILLVQSAAFSQSWLENYEKSLEAYDNFQLTEARSYGEKALSEYLDQNSSPDKNLSVILRQIALVCSEQQDFESGAKYAFREVKLLDSLGLNADINYVNAIYNLSLCKNEQEEYAAIKPELENALKICEFQVGRNTVDYALIQGQYAVALKGLNETQKAEELFRSSIQTLEKSEEVPLDYFSLLYQQGLLYLENNYPEKAIGNFGKIKSFYEQEGPSIELGNINTQIGDTYYLQQDFENALKYAKSANQVFTQINDQKSNDAAIAKSLSINSLIRLNKYQQALDEIENYRSGLDQKSRSYKTNSVNYANLLMQLGEFDKSKNVLEELENQFLQKEMSSELFQNYLISKTKNELHFRNLESANQAIILGLKQGESFEILHLKAQLELKKGDYRKARSSAGKALELALSKLPAGHLKSAEIKGSLAQAYMALGDLNAAEDLFLGLLPIYEKTYGGDHPDYATALANYSSLKQLRGQLTQAEDLLQQALQIKKRHLGENNLEYLVALENFGLLLLNTGQYTEAQQIFAEVLPKKKTLSAKSSSLGDTYRNLGNVNKQLALYPEAEKALKESRDIFRSTLGQNHVFYASSLNSLGLLYLKMGNIAAAKSNFSEALALYKKAFGENSLDYASVLENLATTFKLNSELEKAQQSLEVVLKIDQELLGTDHPLYAKTLHNLAAVYDEKEEYQKSKELNKSALEIEERVYGKWHPSYANTLYNLAVLEQELENYGEANQYYEQVVSIRKEILGEQHPDYAYALYGLASVQQKQGKFEDARKNYDIVITKYKTLIADYFPSLSESEKAAFYGRIRPIFEAYFDFAIDYVLQGQGSQLERYDILGDIYDLQLATKALLLSSSNKVRNRILSSGDQNLISLFNDWIALKERLVKLYSLSRNQLIEAKISISDLEEKANEMEKRLSTMSTIFAGEFDKSDVSWQDVKKQLQPNEAAIEVIRVKKNLKNDSVMYAALILEPTKLTPDMVVLLNGRFLESRGIKGYKNSIVFQFPDRKSYSLFWKSIGDRLSDTIDEIYLSADGVYNKLNVATLWDPEKNEYLVDRYNFRLLSNTKELIEEQTSKNATTPAFFGFPLYNLTASNKQDLNVMFGGTSRGGFGEIVDLPGTLEEINNISTVLEAKSVTYEKFIEVNANEQQIKSLSNPKILHVATHGFFLEDIQVDEESGGLSSRNAKFNPLLRSGLLLSGAQNTINNEDIPGEEDGILTAYEAMNLNFDETELVVMSACETGLGEVKNGEGVYGLQRSFLVAGAQNLLMSLWKVNDETTQLLMSNFYKNWYGGMEKSEAFKNAVSSVKAKFDKPYFWGAFVLVGK